MIFSRYVRGLLYFPSPILQILRHFSIIYFDHSHLDGFSANVKDILYNFSGGEEKGLSPIYETLARKRLILKITQAFAEADLSQENVDNHGMGTIGGNTHAL